MKQFFKDKQTAPALLVAVVYAVTRIVFVLKGGAFLARPITFAMQYLDPVLLKEDLLHSLLYLHIQPPLFNCFLGVVLKVSPHPEISFALLYKTAGLLMVLFLFGTLAGLGLNRWLAAGVAIVFLLNPTVFLYEHLLYYTFIEGFLVLGAVFFLQRWCAGKRTADLLLFWVGLLSLGLMRSLFHPVFFLIIGVVTALYLLRRYGARQAARQFTVCAAVVLLVMVAVCVKNMAVYGFFGTTSWTGMSLWTKANGFSPDKLEELYEQGVVSETALKAELQAFQPLSYYYSEPEIEAITCHHPADCTTRRSTGRNNFNHAGYVQVSRQLMQDARSVIAYDPGMFAFFTASSFSLTLWHASDSVHGLFQDNMAILQKLEKLYRFMHFGFLGITSKHAHPGMWIRTGVYSLLLLLVYAGTLRGLFRKKNPFPPGTAVVCLFCLLVHGYTLGVSSLIEFGENNRFRFPLDGAFLVLMAGNGIMLFKSIYKKIFPAS